MNYINLCFFAFDRFLNAVCGGSPYNTISARIGYHSKINPAWHSKYWKLLEVIVDSTFYPVDGNNHCIKAYELEINSDFIYESGNDLFRALLGVIVFLSCIFLWPVIRILEAIK